jgi:hypothetical protein
MRQPISAPIERISGGTSTDTRGGSNADVRGGSSADTRGGSNADVRGGTSADTRGGSNAGVRNAPATDVRRGTRRVRAHHCAAAALLGALWSCTGGDAVTDPQACRPGAVAEPAPGGGWRKVPAIVIAAAPADPRLPAVHEAIEYWNQVFAELGTPFRLGSVTVTTPLPDACVAAISAQVLAQAGMPGLPDEVRQLPGELIIALTDSDLISFASGPPSSGKVLVGIRSHRLYPLTLPNVTRNLVAHELGHALGLGHNDDPAMLMCGRPAPCRPDAFHSTAPRWFPLTDNERAMLRLLYPAGWTPTSNADGSS